MTNSASTLAPASTPVISLDPAVNPASPYFLHHNDNPAISIALEPLDGQNFVSWRQSVARGLSVKNKLPLVDGSIPVPTSEDIPVYAAYVRANNLVLQWILNSVSPEIKKTLRYFTTAKDVWTELIARYECCDLSRIFQLEKSLTNIAQGSKSLVSYYNEFKFLWDEHVSHKPVFSCSCGVLAKCSCDLMGMLAKSQEQDCVMKFLIGLSDSYAPIRSQFLLQKPFPPLAKVYSLLLQEESQRALYLPSPVLPESIAMLANNSRFYKDKKKPLKCTHCNGTTHSVDRCFELIGYPPGWKGQRGSKNRFDVKEKSANNLVSSPEKNVGNVGTNPIITQELLEQLLAMAKQANKPDGNHSAAGVFAHTLPDPAGGIGGGTSEGQGYPQGDWLSSSDYPRGVGNFKAVSSASPCYDNYYCPSSSTPSEQNARSPTINIESYFSSTPHMKKEPSQSMDGQFPFDIFEERNKSVPKLKTPLHVKNEAMRNEKRRLNQGDNIQVIRPGMILLKGYISLMDQVKLIKSCQNLGRGPGGFYQPCYRDGAKLHLKMMCLGKHWDPETCSYGEIRPVDQAKPPPIPNEFQQLVKGAIQKCHAHMESDNSKLKNSKNSLPSMSPNICIINFYTHTGKIGLHQDKGESEESLRKGLPVVSLSLGDSAEFLFGDQRDIDKAEKVILESGDVLIFGGESRHIFHGVSSVKPNTAPKPLLDETHLRLGRLNLTFREY